jgi:hypothetical protein
MLKATNAAQMRSMLNQPTPAIVAFGVLDGPDAFYFCAQARCVDYAAQWYEDRMPLTQHDLNGQAFLYPETRIRCSRCGTDLIVYGPDPRD